MKRRKKMKKAKNDEKTCWSCKNFVCKIMLNGYNGVCGIKPLEESGFVRFGDTCEKWEERDGE